MSSVNGFPVILDTYARVLSNSKRCTGERRAVQSNNRHIKLNVFSFRFDKTDKTLIVLEERMH